MESLKEMGIALCETCDGYVPTTQVGEDVYCAFEYAEYPDIATLVG